MRRHSVLTSNGGVGGTSLVQEFGVSCLAASLAHIPHHPLYTLKSQMMFYGREFSFFNFLRRARVTKGTFLFQGLVPRTFGIAPEKALKMQAWVLVGRWVDRHVDNPTITKWLMAGAAAGAATTLIAFSYEPGEILGKTAQSLYTFAGSQLSTKMTI